MIFHLKAKENKSFAWMLGLVPISYALPNGEYAQIKFNILNRPNNTAQHQGNLPLPRTIFIGKVL